MEQVWQKLAEKRLPLSLSANLSGDGTLVRALVDAMNFMRTHGMGVYSLIGGFSSANIKREREEKRRS